MAQTIQRNIIRNQLLLQVSLLYYDIQLNLLQQDVLAESKSRAENQLKQLRNALSVQQVTSFDTLEVANRKLQITTQLSNLVDIFNILISKMEYFLNSEINESIDKIVVSDLDLNFRSNSEYLMLALSNRPELQQNSSIQRAQFFKIGVEKSNFGPLKT